MNQIENNIEKETVLLKKLTKSKLSDLLSELKQIIINIYIDSKARTAELKAIITTLYYVHFNF
ncbi:MAG: hypothetical protein ACP5NA_07710 [Candidatus Acidulodesulfobacterium sp.]